MLAAAALVALTLSGCTGSAPSPAATPAAGASDAASTATPTTSPAPAPSLNPSLSASENLRYFTAVITAVLAADPATGGRGYIDGLVAGGFDKSQMEVTFDETDAGLAADTVQFSVLFNGQCLIGQNGPATGGFHSTVAEPLGGGTCLVGSTRQIDW